MNRLDALPEALSDYIYYLRDCATTIQIQTAWRKYKAQITMLKKLQNDCQWIDQGYGLYSKRLNVVYSADVAKITEYITKQISGKENLSNWLPFILSMNYELWAERNDHTNIQGGGWPIDAGHWTQYYNRIDTALETIKQKFNHAFDKMGGWPYIWYHHKKIVQSVGRNHSLLLQPHTIESFTDWD
jgi:hypothetical protein